MADKPRPTIKAKTAGTPKKEEKPAGRKAARMTADTYAKGKSSKFGKELGGALIDTVNDMGRKKPSQALAENLDDRLKRKK